MGLREKEFDILKKLEWGIGLQKSTNEIISDLKGVGYKKINGLEDAFVWLKSVSNNTHSEKEKEAINNLINGLSNLSDKKQKIVDKYLKGCWVPDEEVWKGNYKDAEGFNIQAKDDGIIKVLSFRGFNPEDVEEINKSGVKQGELYIFLHELRHLVSFKSGNNENIFNIKIDPLGEAGRRVSNEGFFEKLASNLPQSSPIMTNIKSDIGLNSNHVLAGEIKADYFSLLILSGCEDEFNVLKNNLASYRRASYTDNGEDDYAHNTSDALLSSEYKDVNSLF